MPGIGDDETKRLIKEAIKEWLDERFAEFGRWSFKAIMALALGVLFYLSLKINGWTKLP